jgi:D-beta-D-heptose 7-phosphate kinase / D-beta-D-heptose 1-phosphate adenosyltransferase
VTLDTDGALLFERDRVPYRLYAHGASQICPIGAGDTFVAALALGLAAGASTPTAAEFASAAAAVVVRRGGHLGLLGSGCPRVHCRRREMDSRSAPALRAR